MANRSGRKTQGNRKLILFIILVIVVFLIYNNADKLNLPNIGDAKVIKTEKKKEEEPAKAPDKKKSSRKTEPKTAPATTSFDFENNLDFALPAFTDQDQIVRHQAYSLSYADEFEQPYWVAYQLTASEVKGKSERENDFRPDPDVKTGSATPDDYRGSGYDRGHLAPAADFKFSNKAMSESFFMSNMSPQAPEFNREIWEHLESRVRSWVKKDQVLYVVTGPVLKGKMSYIGRRNKVAVPPMYFKVILDLYQPDVKAIAFLMKNEGSNEPLESFAVTIDEVEKETGLDFFPLLPDDMEQKLESSLTISDWFKGK
ncbi:DNA/RNA non-specific endonuclease [Rhodocytophaga rosea]|uniref:Endonuclease n=1 Tax=Rhodocytophaga rosea TaxID=2704465 RepID=A0A6C0GCS0_9BACT|nr:DNA/RNA non-specific endonuclease [Rhodocytophaga rosea]QHT65644.1 DNA/RNA non-specific endonuclease [Rhodocytophaga rosea]